MPTTVDGYTKAGADAAFATIDHVHPPSGGGGGGPLGISFLKMPSNNQHPNFDSSHMIAYFDQFTEQNVSGDSLGVTSEAGSMGWAYANAGWYQLTFKLWVGFTAVTAPIPDIVLFEWASYEGAEVTLEIPVTPNPGDFMANRALPGCQFSVTTPPYYSPGVAEASAIDGSNTASLKWWGDAVLSNGNGGPANPLTFYATRLS